VRPDVKNFARGLSRRPYGPTWRKLLGWSARQPPPIPASDDVEAAVSLLTRDLAPAVRERVAAEIRRIVDAVGAPTPALPQVPSKGMPFARRPRHTSRPAVPRVALGRLPSHGEVLSGRPAELLAARARNPQLV
jgi:hypothetical protein